ncbi:hypothetical protein AVEN_21746-1 [Araneus ventricosus]|uniref:Uncharacterized protein n=1 Tax=Araneus ventricosus TaxID=182803 RepID=A0A4Y2EXD8_ARAVE|nr:hypothetical protein AVEN_21746-1 [Araneus ventricosus]
MKVSSRDQLSLKQDDSKFFHHFLVGFLNVRRPRWPSGKVLALAPEASRFETRFHSRVWDLLHAQSYVVAKHPPPGVEWKFGKGGASSCVGLVV